MVEELGADAYVYGRARIAGSEHQLVTRVDGRRPPARGGTLHLAPDPERTHLFGADGRRLG